MDKIDRCHVKTQLTRRVSLQARRHLYHLAAQQVVRQQYAPTALAVSSPLSCCAGSVGVVAGCASSLDSPVRFPSDGCRFQRCQPRKRIGSIIEVSTWRSRHQGAAACRAPALFEQPAQLAALLYSLRVNRLLTSQIIVKTGSGNIESAADQGDGGLLS